MTGAYLRAKRGDKFENVEIEHLTDAELEEKFSSRDPAELVNWIKMLCGTIRRLEPLLDELVRDGILTLVDKEPAAADQADVLPPIPQPAEEPEPSFMNVDVLDVDPPSGWRYGFPKTWDRRTDPDMVMWLIKNGYPEKAARDPGLVLRFLAVTQETRE